jgi:hypothetical protein
MMERSNMATCTVLMTLSIQAAIANSLHAAPNAPQNVKTPPNILAAL